MSKIDVEQNLIIISYDSVDWNNLFNKIKPNLKYFDYKNSLNNCVNYSIKMYQLTITISSIINRRNKNL